MIGSIAAVIPISFSSGSFLSYPLPGFSSQWYEKVFQMGPRMSALKNSMIIEISSATLATILGTLAALGFARSNIFTQQLLMGIVISPMIIQLVVSGVAMYFFLAKLGAVGDLCRVDPCPYGAGSSVCGDPRHGHPARV
ncbi:MAG: ABC transporter permease [Sulfitobacter sp.]